MRWVLDTNVLLDWLIFRDRHVTALVSAIESGAAVLLTRADCRDEFMRVLDYPQVLRFTEARATALATYDRWHHVGADLLTGTPAPLPQCRDADDQKFLELARDCGAHWLITKDKALLELAGPARRAAGFEVLDPVEASRRLRAGGVVRP